MPDIEDITVQQEALERVLGSGEFQASPQSRKFLQYVSQRAFSGGPQVDQAEIAREVLERGRDFDPTTDASVRKLAMQVRQRLESYYAGAGAGDSILISLPLRSYSPRFQERAPAEAGAGTRTSRPRWLFLGAGAAIVLTGILWLLWPPAAKPISRVRIFTQRGDITYPRPDNAPGSLRLLGEVGTAEDVFVQLTFRPDRERQHAGLVIWEGPRRYVSLGRRFTSHNYVTFGYEYDSYLASHPVNEIEDPDAQAGGPLWLRLSRNGNRYAAFTSLDGREWRAVGEPLTLPHALKNPRAGIFAVNGRRDSPSIPADFEFPGTGLILPTAITEGPWRFHSDCREGAALFTGMAAAAGQPPCAANWSRPAPAGQWSITTRLDMLSNPVLVAGLSLQLEKGRVRLLRYPSDGPKISLVHDGVKLESIPDFPGSPPVYLRMAVVQGHIEAAASVDGRDYRPVGSRLSLAQLGRPRSVGVTASNRAETSGAPVPPLWVYFVGVSANGPR